MLKLFELPASSLIVKFAPLENPDAAGSLISSAADAETPSIRSLTDDVVVDVTAVLEKTAEDNVTVTLLPLLDAATAAPTKSILVAAVVMFEPSSLIVRLPPAEDEMSVNFSLRYLPV